MKFFVSYSRSVQDQVREIIASLRDSGDEVWWDQDLRAGQDWWGTILNNIEACEVCLFFISEKSVQSPYCMEELRYALDRNRLVLPFVMDAPVTYTIPPEIMQGRIQYETYTGIPNQLKHRIRTTCQGVNWDQYRNRYTARPPEPNTEANDLVERLSKASALANEGHFDEAIKRFNDVSRNDPDSYGEFCHTWIDKIRRYQDVIKHANSPALKSLAKQRWDAFLQQFTGDDFFDPLNIQAKFAVTDLPAKRTGLLSAVKEMTAEEYLERGKNRSEDDLDGKIADYTEAIRLNPQLPQAYSKRGGAYYDSGDYDRAIADCSEAIRLDPKYIDAYYNRGTSYNAKEDYDRAIADFTEAIRLNPQDVDAYNNRGLSYGHKKDYNRAIADFSEVIRLNPQHAIAYCNRGFIYNAKKDYDRAIEDYTEAIHLNPQDVYAYNNRGSAYHDGKKAYDRAIVDYDAALRINPNYELARSNRQLAIDAKKKRGY